MIKIICLGKIKETYLQEAIKDYKKRIQKYTKIEIIELKDEKDTDQKTSLKKEYENIKKHITEKDNLILLDPKGKNYTSNDLAETINKELTYHSNITFLIGSSNGFFQELKDKIPKKISFSSLTFPHGLFRVILLEQIYRSFKIINNETYHK